MLKHMIRDFFYDTRAAVSLEAIVVFPILTWAWIGTFAFFDAYRIYNSSIKATYTISDLLSRETDIIYSTDIDGMASLMEAIIRETDGVDLRVTQIQRYVDGSYRVDWSHATGGRAQLFTANLPEIQSRIPNIAEGERLILVESFIDYSPAFNIGLNDVTFENFTVTRPRYAGQVPFSTTPPNSTS